ERSDIGSRDDIDEMHGDKARRRALLGPMADAADMMAVAQANDRAARGLGALDAQLHGAVPSDLPHSALRIENDHPPHVGNELELGGQLQPTGPKTVEIHGDYADPVGIVPAQIGFHQMRSDKIGGFAARAE